MNTEDFGIFKDLLSDMFPGFKPCYVLENDINPQIEQIILKKHLNLKPEFIERARDLYSMVQDRFGVCLLGPTLSGKTQLIHILADALDLRFQNEKTRI